MTAEGVAQEDVIGLHRVGSEQQTAGGDGEEVVRLFEGGGFGVTAFGATVAHEQSGDVVGEEVLVEVREQLAKMAIGIAVLTGEQVDKGVKKDKASANAFNGGKEVSEVFG